MIGITPIGRLGFTREPVRDVLTFPLLADSEIALMDINPERLTFSKRSVEKIISLGNYPATVSATLDRVAALRNADVVLTTILTGTTSDLGQIKFDINDSVA